MSGFRLGTAPLSNSWLVNITWLYIALDRTPNIYCYWVGAVPKAWGCSVLGVAIAVACIPASGTGNVKVGGRAVACSGSCFGVLLHLFQVYEIP